jgi:hypothetical protein
MVGFAGSYNETIHTFSLLLLTPFGIEASILGINELCINHCTTTAGTLCYRSLESGKFGVMLLTK